MAIKTIIINQGKKGEKGDDGADGTNGSNGIDGNTVLSGTGVPSSGLGVDGDYYVDSPAFNIYGPKTSGVWGSPTSLIGPAGSDAPDQKNYIDTAGNFLNIAASNGTTVLDATGPHHIILTGTQNHTFQMPDPNTLEIGTVFLFINRSTGVLNLTKSDTTPLGGTGPQQIIRSVLLNASPESYGGYQQPIYSDVDNSMIIQNDLLPQLDLNSNLGLPTDRWANIWGDFISATSSIGLRDTSANPFFTASMQSPNGFLGGYWRDSNVLTGADGFGFFGRNNNSSNATARLLLATGNNSIGSSGGVLLRTGTSSSRGKIGMVDGSEGTIGHVWTSIDTLGNGHWTVLPSGSGANTSLSNLASTDINADLIFHNPNSGADTTAYIMTGSATSPVFDNRSPNMVVTTGDNNFGNSGNMTVKTGYARLGGAVRTSGTLLLTSGNGHSIGFSNDGNSGNTILTTGDGEGFGGVGSTFIKTGFAAWVQTGDIWLNTGNSTNAPSGSIIVKPGTGTARGKFRIEDGSEGTTGHVWTSTDTLGNGHWAAAGGGGGGSALTVQDEGSNLSTAVTKINFVGAGVTATQPVANEILVTIPGVGGWTTSIKTVADNNAVISAGSEVFADTTSAFTLLLPASPALGDKVRFIDKKGTWTTNNLTIDRNGKNIKGAASNFALNVNFGSAEFVYSDVTDGWLVLTNYT